MVVAAVELRGVGVWNDRPKRLEAGQPVFLALGMVLSMDREPQAAGQHAGVQIEPEENGVSSRDALDGDAAATRALPHMPPPIRWRTPRITDGIRLMQSS